MYSIIDIETTGVKPGHSKIIEIAIVNHDGEKIVQKWSSLIDPECKIQYFITNLTGITNKMVEGAPKFYEVAKKIVEMTKDSVFVAHNVGFDYGFIKAEFKELGYSFNKKKLCTVRLGRKIIPGHKSYSLGKITKDLGISLTDAHRAMGDTLATVELFERYLKIDKEYILEQVNSQSAASLPLPPHVPKNEVDSLPEEGGLYYFYDKNGELLYVGKANNIKKRVFQHFATRPGRGKGLKLHNLLHHIDSKVFNWELLTLILENLEIKAHNPPLNRAGIKTKYPFGIFYCEETKCLSLRKEKEGEIPLLAFSSKTTALRQFEKVVRNLNLEFLQENQFKINELQLKILKTYWQYPKQDVLLVQANRFIKIEKGVVISHGKMGEDEQFYDISRVQENPEIRALILRFWGKQNLISCDNKQQNTPHILGLSSF
ncbi:MAG: DNA polymerase-3 subunit epsilon [Bacteriovoracaceae bacterium]|jgi:DNA polymerase-3 subunit epsilon